MKKWGIAVIFAAIIAVAMFAYIKTAEPTVTINGHVIKVEIENTDATRERGLGGRTSLANDHGMLFVFDTDGTYPFWMKDMNFPIDMIWISSDGHVVDMHENVASDTYPQTFSSQVPARYVLELSANAVKRLDLHVGDIVRL